MSETKRLKIDLKIYDPTIKDIREGTQIKIKGGDLESLKEILKKYFG